jgi:4-hydroxy-tetrahydrodipicolinate synthase
MTPHRHASQRPAISGLWLPLITPFRDGRLDENSLRRLVRHYEQEPLDGLIIGATTGEGLTLDEAELERLVNVVADTAITLPLYLGLAGSDTARMAERLDGMAAWPIDGYLISCPYYSRPSQDGLVRHFVTLAGATDRPVMIYNIPYRTGVNLRNPAMLELAEIGNIIGVKDCCDAQAQSLDLIQRKSDDFAVMTGEDALYFTALTQGADGGILASAHVDTRHFARLRHLVAAGDLNEARENWRHLIAVPRLLFAEPSPAPVKYWLYRRGLIDSPEVRLPMTDVSDTLAGRIDAVMEQAAA